MWGSILEGVAARVFISTFHSGTKRRLTDGFVRLSFAFWSALAPISSFGRERRWPHLRFCNPVGKLRKVGAAF